MQHPENREAVSRASATWRTATSLALRFTPDLLCLFIGIVIFLQKIPDAFGYWLRNVGYEFAALIIIFCFMFQKKEERSCLSRIVMESAFVRTVGYASYPIYVLHVVIINFYFRMIFDAVLGRKVLFDPSYGVQNEWFSQHLPMYYFPLAVMLVVGLCYPVQKYYQDTFIAGLWLKFIHMEVNTKSSADPREVRMM